MTTPTILSRPLAARVLDLLPMDERHENPPLSEAVMDAAFASFEAGHTHYTDRSGILPLRERVVASLRARFSLDLKPDQVTITCGATEARFVTLKVLAAPDTTVLTAGSGARIAAAAAVVGVRVSDDPTAERVALIYVTPADDRTNVDRLLERARSEDTFILWDLSVESSDGFHPAQDASLAPRVVTVGSYSDALPGWRVGWLAGSQMASKLRAYKQSMTICTTSVSQWAALGLED
jgi:arginine:pyruvate transaminase